MLDDFHAPNHQPNLAELSDSLRQAVEYVRAEPVPQDALARSLERARRLDVRPVKSRQRMRSLLAMASMAAVLMIGVFAWPTKTGVEAQRHLIFGPREASIAAHNQTWVDGLEKVDGVVLLRKHENLGGPTTQRVGGAFRIGQETDEETLQRLRTELRLIEAEEQRGRSVLEEDWRHGHFPAGLADARQDSGGGFGGFGGMLGGLGGGGQGQQFRPSGFLNHVDSGKAKKSQIQTLSADRMLMSSADFAAAEKTRDETYQRFLTQKRLYADGKGNAISYEEFRGAYAEYQLAVAKLNWLRAGGKPDGPEAQQVLQKEEDLAYLRFKILERLHKGGAYATTEEEWKDAQRKWQEARKNRLAGTIPQTWQRDGRRPTFARVYIGDGNSLDLVSLQVTVTVEGPRARTVVDHIFHNPHNRQLEGSFEYPLPTGASPSYFAMFIGQTRDAVPPRFARRGQTAPLPQDALAQLTPAQLVRHVDPDAWGGLREARIVPKEKALETYEDIVRGRIDPALLEYAGGNTFSGRVFPIPAKGYNRVLIAYEELLPVAGHKVLYRFPLPELKLNELQFSLQANGAECKEPSFLPKNAKKEEGGGRLVYSRTWTNEKPDGDVVYTYTPSPTLPHPWGEGRVGGQIQAISGRQGENGPRYFYARIRPELATVENPQPFAKHAVFLLDTSLSEHPDRFAVNMQLLRKILVSDPDIKHFNILTFNVGSAWVEPKGWLPNTPAGREQAFARLDGIVLEGATDLSAALDRLVQPGFAITPGTPLHVFLLSDGQITWGESDATILAARFESRCPFRTRFSCYRTGIGADNLELFEALARRGGGIYNCFTEAELAGAAQAHRRQCLQVDRVRLVGGPAASDVLVAGRQAAIYPGGELIVAARLNGTGHTNVVVEGTFLGKKFAQEYPVEITGSAELAPRGWAEIAVASLLALNDAKLDPLVTAYCQEFGIGSRVASFLVLENDADYKRFNLEAERGKTVADDLGQFLESMWTNLGRVVPAKEAFERFLAQLGPRVQLTSGDQGAYVQKLLALLKDADFELPENHIAGAILHKADVPPGYLAERDKNPGDVSVYLTEAHRRAAAKDADGAVRVLSSVVEAYPARSDALRLVGYRLLDLKQPAEAARLFQRVQRSRPFEPHSYRDLARGLEEGGKFGLAALQYEIILAGAWHNRFGDAIKMVAREEYAHMLREAVARKAVSKELANHFGERLEQMDGARLQSDLRVTISWNTDATDVDLWVIEPDGTKCFYSAPRTPSGGELSQDQTQGYGPERYQIKKAHKGVYRVLVHYYRGNPNLLSGETHVNVVVTRHAGTPQETVERHTVILKKQDEAIEVCRVEF